MMQVFSKRVEILPLQSGESIFLRKKVGFVPKIPYQHVQMKGLTIFVEISKMCLYNLICWLNYLRGCFSSVLLVVVFNVALFTRRLIHNQVQNREEYLADGQILFKFTILFPLELSSGIWPSFFFSSTLCIYLPISQHKFSPLSSVLGLPYLRGSNLSFVVIGPAVCQATLLFSNQESLPPKLDLNYQLPVRKKLCIDWATGDASKLWFKKKQRILGLPGRSCHHVLNISCRSFRYLLKQTLQIRVYDACYAHICPHVDCTVDGRVHCAWYLRPPYLIGAHGLVPPGARTMRWSQPCSHDMPTFTPRGQRPYPLNDK